MIEVKDVTKKYGNTTALDHISFQIQDGEVVGFLGPNGAGKSTTMNILTGFIEPTSGEVKINGININKRNKKIKTNIGYMPENIPLYSELTIKEFVEYMADLKKIKRKDRKKECEKVIEETGLKIVEKQLIKNLSRGYKQRVSLAGALVGNPDVIILDEPTAGLDPKQVKEIRKLIKQLGSNHTIILSSHILTEISQICNKVIIINHGKIVAIDTPEHLETEANERNAIIVTVEDPENKMSSLKNKMYDIEKIELIKDNEDGTKEFLITPKAKIDIRRKIFDVLSKESITIFELKSVESSLEDAFIKIIDNKTQKNKNKKEEEK